MNGTTSTMSSSSRRGAEGLTLRVASKSLIANGVMRVELESDDPLPPWEPGAHVDLHLRDGLSRQYSLCGSPDDNRRWSIAVLLEADGRGGSRFVHEELSVGGVVEATGPRNHFPFDPASEYVFVAGGIGITPILPMIGAAEHAGVPWRLVYGGRTEASMAFLAELTARGPQVEVLPFDRVGHPDLAGMLAEVRPGALVYSCGPEGLLQAVEVATRHWPSGSLRTERFAVEAVDAPSTAFDVELVTSQVSLHVPADRSILEVAEDAGVWVPSSCQAGTCGTCETKVLSGVPDHRDAVLSDDEKAQNDYMMICVSRCASGPLVLEL